MMSSGKKMYFLVFWYILLAGFGTEALNNAYDYSSSIECLENPLKPQYGGGIILNPELNHGLRGWSKLGGAQIGLRREGKNTFIVAHGRNQSHDSVSQKIYLQKGMLYAFSAWIQLSEGKAPVEAVFKTKSELKHAGAIVAESKCWSMLKGGLTVDRSGLADLYFKSKNTSIEIWVDSISLQPFTQEQWRSHQDASIEKAPKRNVKIQVVDKEGNPLENSTIFIKLKKPTFPLGSAISNYILNNTAYQNWFLSRFTFTNFANEIKWTSTEPNRGQEDYSLPDAMLKFTKLHNIPIRGHNVLWDSEKEQPNWINSLSRSDLLVAITKRINSLMGRYRGEMEGWDVLNENLHYNFFESKLGANASGLIYNLALKTDPTSHLFMNEYNTIEYEKDYSSLPAKYLEKLREIKDYPGNRNGRFAIGLQGHFGVPNLPYVRATIDTLASASVPIWITELDVGNGTYQTKYLEQVLRELHGHPKVNGIVLGTAWEPWGCFRMCLTDDKFRNLPTGDVVDKLLKEWGYMRFSDKTDSEGFFETSLSYGDYSLEVTQQAKGNSSLGSSSFKVYPAVQHDQTLLHLKVSS